jgi:hypothetical protein
MYLKKLPLSFIIIFTIIESGFFYAQEIPSQYICPRGDSLHRGFICQCSNPTIHFDSISLKKLRIQAYCPRGIHNFICQCGPDRYSHDKKFIIVKKQKKFKRNRKSPKLQQ